MAQQRRRHQRGPWGEGKPASLVVLTAICLASVVFCWPLGLALYVIFCALFSAWPGPENYEDEDAQKRATLLRAIAKAMRSPNFGSLGFGEPGEVEGTAQSQWPPTRISSWWSLIVAVPCAFIPYVRLGPITAVCIFVFGQSIAKGVRATRDPSGPAPTPLLRFSEASRILARDAAKIGFIATLTGVAGVAGALFIPGAQVWQRALVIVAAVVLPAFAYFGHMYTVEFLAEWKQQITTRKEWEQRWLSIPHLAAAPPTWVATLKVPVDNPTHEKIIFAVPPGSSIAKYEPFTSNLATSLSTDMVTVTPMPLFDSENKVIPGTAQQQGFIVTRALQSMGPHPHLDPQLDKATRSFAITWAVGEAFRALKMARPDLVSIQALTTAESPGLLVETQWRLGAGSSAEDLMTKAGALQEKLDARWLRIGRRAVAKNGERALAANNVSIVFGDLPNDVKLRPPVRNVQFLLDQLNFDSVFRKCSLANPAAPIQVAPFTVNNRDITERIFQVAEGISIDSVKKKVPELRGATGYGYVAIDVDEKRSDRFRLLTGTKDPLDADYLFIDYMDQILVDPEKGDPKIDWVVGIGTDGELMVSKWESDIAHILIAGATGMGKSVLINSMIIQMCHNTHPDDLQLRLLEPKNELQRFASLQHVTHLVDMQTPGESHYHNAADLLADTAAEMERRYATFDKHPAKPKKLSEARFIASTEGPLPNGQRHPLQMPYMVVIIEECADFFHTPSLRKQFGEAHEKVIYYVELLARKARATGIYLVIATQYPTNTNLPQTLKQMCRRVGLGTGDQNASRVIIDQNGLEDITVPGRGLFSYGKSYRGFRSLYLRAPDQAHPDLPNDLAEIMSAIPQRDSSGHVYFGAGGTPASNDPAPIPAGIWDT